MLPELKTPIPGPRSRALLERLGRVESPNVTFLNGAICWEEAEGTNVWDADGNRLLDLTAAFAVAAIGHRHPATLRAMRQQADTLIHGMGDVHPSRIKVELLELLAEIAPGDLSLTILGCNGADAIEAALKTALLTTRRPGVVAFTGGYHGLSYGAVALSGRAEFAAPFDAQLNPCVRFAEYPDGARVTLEQSLQSVEQAIRDLDTQDIPVGAIVVEPIQGRGGVVVPPERFLRAIQEAARSEHALLVCDEIYTGCGRTGTWFACDAEGVVPDLLCIGKGLSSGFPISACIGTPGTMAGWPESTGEALHTYTFLGHPLGCAMAIASLNTIRHDGLVEKATADGIWLGALLQEQLGGHPGIGG
ncbi:MAG TPA: aspartate aminotransferase family protein, partial [bacterium]|nr:aspartate aminotransferase family protein [bacterium]